jgi:hypothetical protein
LKSESLQIDELGVRTLLTEAARFQSWLDVALTREVVRDPGARYWGGRVEKRSLVPSGQARLGPIGLDEWLRRSQPKA